ncbi:hypothetical protein K7432_009516 [Basidiobolus ranarum]|uniref:Uncharacterized protein n=1 Tax=Basidiobolus ranarum TaxID=34480 RepID=A0ABR2VWZ3_9FUNG
MDDVWQQHIQEYNIDVKLLDTTLIPILIRTQEDVERALQQVPTLKQLSCTEGSIQSPFGHGESGIGHLKAAIWPQIQAGLVKRNVLSDASQMTDFIDKYFMKLQRLYDGYH